MTLFLAGSPIGLEEEGLNLFLDSPTTNAVTLYMQGQAAELDEGVPLVVGGAAPIQQGVDLSVPVVVAEYEAGVSLYTRGW